MPGIELADKGSQGGTNQVTNGCFSIGSVWKAFITRMTYESYTAAHENVTPCVHLGKPYMRHVLHHVELFEIWRDHELRNATCKIFSRRRVCERSRHFCHSDPLELFLFIFPGSPLPPLQSLMYWGGAPCTWLPPSLHTWSQSTHLHRLHLQTATVYLPLLVKPSCFPVLSIDPIWHVVALDADCSSLSSELGRQPLSLTLHLLSFTRKRLGQTQPFTKPANRSALFCQPSC